MFRKVFIPFILIIIFMISIFSILLLKPQIIINNIHGYLNNKLSDSFNWTCDIADIDGNFVTGFNIAGVNCYENNEIIFSTKGIYIDPNLSDIAFGKLSLSEVIITSAFINIDKYRMINKENYDNNLESINYRVQ